jgi:hypothetical protein
MKKSGMPPRIGYSRWQAGQRKPESVWASGSLQSGQAMTSVFIGLIPASILAYLTKKKRALNFRGVIFSSDTNGWVCRKGFNTHNPKIVIGDKGNLEGDAMQSGQFSPGVEANPNWLAGSEYQADALEPLAI